MSQNQVYILDEAHQRRLGQKRLFERVTGNGTIAAAVMVLAAIVAVVAANTDLYYSIHDFLAQPVTLAVGPLSFSMSVELFVNDFLMAVFFLLVGIELKYEMTVGQLTRPRQALLPMLAAVGGVVVPATIYAVVNRGGAVYGWAIPMATDIAFALGVLSLLGKRVPAGIKVFFSTLAIADDLLAIVAIALFYGHSPSLLWLAASAAVVACLAALNRAQVFSLKPYLLLGLVLWFCVYQSGIHATLAGVILAFCVPVRSDVRAEALVEWLRGRLPDLADRYDDEAHILASTTSPTPPWAWSASCTA